MSDEEPEKRFPVLNSDILSILAFHIYARPVSSTLNDATYPPEGQKELSNARKVCRAWRDAMSPLYVRLLPFCRVSLNDIAQFRFLNLVPSNAPRTWWLAQGTHEFYTDPATSYTARWLRSLTFSFSERPDLMAEDAWRAICESATSWIPRILDIAGSRLTMLGCYGKVVPPDIAHYLAKMPELQQFDAWEGSPVSFLPLKGDIPEGLVDVLCLRPLKTIGIPCFVRTDNCVIAALSDKLDLATISRLSRPPLDEPIDQLHLKIISSEHLDGLRSFLATMPALRALVIEEQRYEYHYFACTNQRLSLKGILPNLEVLSLGHHVANKSFLYTLKDLESLRVVALHGVWPICSADWEEVLQCDPCPLPEGLEVRIGYGQANWSEEIVARIRMLGQRKGLKMVITEWFGR